MGENINKSQIREELHKDMAAYNETKKSINDLMEIQRTMQEAQNSDSSKINDYKAKAIDALNTLFKEK